MIAYGLEWHTLDTYFSFTELSSAPETPEANLLRLYAKDSSGISTLCYKNDAGTEICMPTSGSFVTGTGTDNQVAIWNGTNAIDAFNATAGSIFFAGVGGILAQDNANLFWDDSNNRLGIGTATPAVNLHIQPGTPADSRIRLWSGGALLRSSLEVGRTAADTTLSTAGGAAEFSDIVIAAGESILRATTSHLIVTARSAASIIKFASGAAGSEAVRFQIGAAGQWGIGGATYGDANSIFTSNGAGSPPSWNTTLAVTTVTASGLTQGSVVFAGTGGILSQDNANFFWDDTNNRLGIGTATPTVRLDVNGAAADTRIQLFAGGTADTSVQLGRTAIDGSFSVAGIATSFSNISAVGDTVARGVAGNLIFTVLNGTGNFKWTSGTAGADTEKMRLTNAGLLGIGTVTPATQLDIRIASTTDSPHYFRFGTSGGGFWTGVGARGTVASPTQTQANDLLGGFSGKGYDNAGTPALTGNLGVITVKAAENLTATARGSYITLETTPIGSTTRAERWRINDTGTLIGIATTSFIDLTAVTTKVLKVPTDNTDPTAGGGAATGRIPIHDAAGNLRYIPYY